MAMAPRPIFPDLEEREAQEEARKERLRLELNGAVPIPPERDIVAEARSLRRVCFASSDDEYALSDVDGMDFPASLPDLEVGEEDFAESLPDLEDVDANDRADTKEDVGASNDAGAREDVGADGDVVDQEDADANGDAGGNRDVEDAGPMSDASTIVAGEEDEEEEEEDETTPKRGWRKEVPLVGALAPFPREPNSPVVLAAKARKERKEKRIEEEQEEKRKREKKREEERKKKEAEMTEKQRANARRKNQRTRKRREEALKQELELKALGVQEKVEAGRKKRLEEERKREAAKKEAEEAKKKEEEEEEARRWRYLDDENWALDREEEEAAAAVDGISVTIDPEEEARLQDEIDAFDELPSTPEVEEKKKSAREICQEETAEFIAPIQTAEEVAAMTFEERLRVRRELRVGDVVECRDLFEKWSEKGLPLQLAENWRGLGLGTAFP